jgi:hypothetical protein
MTPAQTGLVLTRMARYLQNRLDGDQIQDPDARSVLWTIRHMLLEGAEECLDVAVDDPAT